MLSVKDTIGVQNFFANVSFAPWLWPRKKFGSVHDLNSELFNVKHSVEFWKKTFEYLFRPTPPTLFQSSKYPKIVTALSKLSA